LRHLETTLLTYLLNN